jgi:hypothetical protein
MGAIRKGQASETEKAEKAVKARRKEKAELVSEVILKIEKKLDENELKPTVGDLLRLLQLEKELEDEEPKEIKVSWVDGGEKEPASEK